MRSKEQYKSEDIIPKTPEEQESSVPEEELIAHCKKFMKDYSEERTIVLDDIPPNLHKEIAMELIKVKSKVKGEERGYYGSGAEVVVENLEKFQGLDLKEIALRLIEEGQGSGFSQNREKFQGLKPEDYQEIILRMCENRENIGASIVWILKEFQGLNHKEIALKLVENGHGHSVISKLEEFQGLNPEDYKEIVLKIFDGRGDSTWNSDLIVDIIMRNLEKLPDSAHKEIALRLIETEQEWHMASTVFRYENLEKLQGLKPEDYQEIFLKYIEKCGGNFLFSKSIQRPTPFEHLEKHLNNEQFALKMLDLPAGGVCLANNLELFKGLNHKEVALKLIETGRGRALMENLEKFQGLDYREVANEIIKQGGGRFVAENIGKFPDAIHKEIASEIIGAGKGEWVVSYMESFKGLDYKEIAHQLIDAGDGIPLAANIRKFKGLIEKSTEHNYRI